MLLPSAFSCDMYTSFQPQKPQRPQLPSFRPYDSPSTPSHSGPAALLASCRALQSMLGRPVQPVQTTSSQPAKAKSALQHNPFSPTRRLQPAPRLVTPPRGMNKRSRDDFEEDLSSNNKESRPMTPVINAYQTPKRQRRIPLDLPQGLSVSDFDALETPDLSRRRQPAPNRGRLFESAEDTPLQSHGTSNRNHQIIWSPDDDHRLIEAVLTKLNLSNRDWNDCAKQLGKDKDTLGRRWRMLIGEGNVGLRRGVGQMERTNLDVKSW